MSKNQPMICQDGTLIPTSPDVSTGMTSHANQVHNKARRRKECWAGRPQMARCEGDCPTCRCYVPKTDPMEMEVYATPDDRGPMRYRCSDILADMQRIDPRGYVIGTMIMHGYTGKAIAAHLGLPESTYRDLLARIRRALREE